MRNTESQKSSMLPTKLLFLYRYVGLHSGIRNEGKKPYGLMNSGHFITNMLKEKLGFSQVATENCVDSNEIDKYVTKHKPKIVILEALWCPPEKFMELFPLHPNVTWIIRIHSHFSFLAVEDIAMKWFNDISMISKKYGKNRVIFAANDLSFCQSTEEGLGIQCLYLPNYYWMSKTPEFKEYDLKSPMVKIGCFGALRIMKNHLMQGVGSIIAAKRLNKYLEFHINANFAQDQHNSTHTNIQSLFSNTSGAKLMVRDWDSHEGFINSTVNSVDLNCQVSFSETFNIVSADSVMMGIPCIVGPNIPWVTDDRVKSNDQNPLLFAEKAISLIEDNKYRKDCWNKQVVDLHAHNQEAQKAWKKFLVDFKLLTEK